MLSVLEKMRKEKKLCETYCDLSDTECFGVGYILDFDEDFYLAEGVSPEGRHGGVYCRLIEDLYRISNDTVYISKIEKLMKARGFKRKKIDFEGETVLDKMLKHINSSGKLCEIEISEECFIFGYIKEIGEDTVLISEVDSYGVLGGQSYIRKSDITCVAFDGEEEMSREILSK